MAQSLQADTICDLKFDTPIPSLPVDPPTLSMLFGANTSPLAGKEGDKLLARQVEAALGGGGGWWAVGGGRWAVAALGMLPVVMAVAVAVLGVVSDGGGGSAVVCDEGGASH